MSEKMQTISPVDGRVYVERPWADEAAIESVLDAAQRAARGWRLTPLAERRDAVEAFVDALLAKRDALADELSWQMGRPRSQAPGELAGFEDRARAMLRLAGEALAPVEPPPKAGFTRYIRREPHGVVLLLSPWNFPWLTTVNALVPALVAGNVVVLKHSDQTPLVAERLGEAAKGAGLPEGVFGFVHATHDAVAEMVGDARVDYVAFTGSVEGGHAITRAASGRFIGVGLELGGKDAAYVRPDAPLDFSAENIVDGAFFNSGQSCCAIERVYVHREVYAPFVERVKALVEAYRLGDPFESASNLGPVVRARNAASIRAQIDAAIAAGARGLIDPTRFPAAAERGHPYLAPEVLVDVDEAMEIMREETFGPVVGIAPVESDDEAIRRINESRYGLTASIWTTDLDEGAQVADALEVGTVFTNRADYLDPELAWVGVKDSGRGATLSQIGYEQLTRPKSFHLRHAPR